MASPMYLSRVPPRLKIWSVMASKVRFRMPASTRGSMPSLMRVNPEMSAKSTLIWQRCACSMGASLFWLDLRIWSTTAGLW